MDPGVPMFEIVHAFNFLIQQGKVRDFLIDALMRHFLRIPFSVCTGPLAIGMQLPSRKLSVGIFQLVPPIPHAKQSYSQMSPTSTIYSLLWPTNANTTRSTESVWKKT
jgi:hypothetical protein